MKEFSIHTEGIPEEHSTFFKGLEIEQCVEEEEITILVNSPYGRLPLYPTMINFEPALGREVTIVEFPSLEARNTVLACPAPWLSKDEVIEYLQGKHEPGSYDNHSNHIKSTRMTIISFI